MKRRRSYLLLVTLAAVGVLLFVLRPAAEEVEDEDIAVPRVSESELDLYIQVYTAMQDDHSLTIEQALRAHQMDVDAFRELERRVQNESHLVDRVREVLLTHVKEHSAYAQSLARPTPVPTPTAQSRSGRPRPER